jgi:hypothetical protein
MYLCGLSCKLKLVHQNSHWSVKQRDFRTYVRSFDKDEKIRQKYSLYFTQKQYIIRIVVLICRFMKLRYIFGTKTQKFFFPLFFHYQF